MLIFIDRVGDNQPEEKKSSYRKSGNVIYIIMYRKIKMSEKNKNSIIRIKKIGKSLFINKKCLPLQPH